MSEKISGIQKTDHFAKKAVGKKVPANKAYPPTGEELEALYRGDFGKESEITNRIGGSGFGRGLLVSAGILGGTTGLLGMYGCQDDVSPPGIYQVVENSMESVFPFDLSKLDTEHQRVVIGKNARVANLKDISDMLGGDGFRRGRWSQRDFTVEGILIKEEISLASLLLSIGQDAGEVTIYRESNRKYLSGEFVSMPDMLRVSVKNKGTKFGQIIPAGIMPTTGELFLDGSLSTVDDGKLLFLRMFMKFKEDNGDDYTLLSVSTTKKELAATDFLKNAPIVGGRDYLKQISKERGLQFNIADTPTLFTTTAPDEEISISVDENKKGHFSFVIPSPQTEPLSGGAVVLIGQPR